MTNENLSDIWPEWQVIRELGREASSVLYEVVRRNPQGERHAVVRVISIPGDEAELASLRARGLSEEELRKHFKNQVDDTVAAIRAQAAGTGAPNAAVIENYRVVEQEETVGWRIYILMAPRPASAGGNGGGNPHQPEQTAEPASRSLPEGIKSATFFLILINVAVFLITSGGTRWAEDYANHYYMTVERQQLYRLVTCMFYHYGFLHLLCNMFSLYNLGLTVERMYGKTKFLFFYFSTGIVGGYLSILLHHAMGDNVLSAGASGAICGLLGVLISNIRGRFSSRLNTLLTAVLPIILVSAQGNVDNIAHWVSLALGIATGLLLPCDRGARRRA